MGCNMKRFGSLSCLVPLPHHLVSSLEISHLPLGIEYRQGKTIIGKFFPDLLQFIRMGGEMVCAFFIFLRTAGDQFFQASGS